MYYDWLKNLNSQSFRLKNMHRITLKFLYRNGSRASVLGLDLFHFNIKRASDWLTLRYSYVIFKHSLLNLVFFNVIWNENSSLNLFFPILANVFLLFRFCQTEIMQRLYYCYCYYCYEANVKILTKRIRRMF